jgi:hypothetical protein
MVGNKTKEENPKKWTKATTQNNKRNSGNTRKENSNRKKASHSGARRDLFKCSSDEEGNENCVRYAMMMKNSSFLQ